MADFTRKQIAEAIDKYQTEHPLFMPMMYDVTSLHDIESADFITKEIRKCQDKIAEDTEMYLICEMAKMYMQGVVPHYEVRRTGEWIKDKEISRTMIGDKVEHIEYKDYTCSNCGLVLDNLLYNYDGSPFYKFCPNCGARMKGGA